MAEHTKGPWLVSDSGIAAAHDLKACLEDLLQEIDLEIEQRQFGGNDEDWLDLKAKSDRAHAAIAKAKGAAA